MKYVKTQDAKDSGSYVGAGPGISRVDGGGQGMSGPINVSGITRDKAIPNGPMRSNTSKPFLKPSGNAVFDSGFKLGYNNVMRYGPPSAKGTAANAAANTRAPKASGVKSYPAAERRVDDAMQDLAFREFKGVAPAGYDTSAPKTDLLGKTMPKVSNPSGWNLYKQDGTGASLGDAYKSTWGQLQGARNALDFMRQRGGVTYAKGQSQRNGNFATGFGTVTGGGLFSYKNK